MLWQDIVVAVANLMFTYSLLYQAYHGFKKKKGFLTLTTSGLTTAGLYAIAIAYFTLSLFISAIVTVFNATIWLILLIQGIIYKKS